MGLHNYVYTKWEVFGGHEAQPTVTCCRPWVSPCPSEDPVSPSAKERQILLLCETLSEPDF